MPRLYHAFTGRAAGVKTKRREAGYGALPRNYFCMNYNQDLRYLASAIMKRTKPKAAKQKAANRQIVDITSNENEGVKSRQGFSAALRKILALLDKSPWYYWYTGNQPVAIHAWTADALIAVVFLVVIPVVVFGDALWMVIPALVLGFALKEAFLEFALLLATLYWLAPLPVTWLMDLLPIGALAFGALWGIIQSRLLAGCLSRLRERKKARASLPQNNAGQSP